MEGLFKAKTYDWRDSNVAFFGSLEDKRVKKSSAEQEPAWQGAGQEVGLKIWRIINFKVTELPESDFGKFFSGDSYIILKTYKRDLSDELEYDLHFWIGGQSSQDEYGTAAYKTVELDTYLDDKPVQHREVDGYESELFKSYFKNGITLLSGGADSGFNHVEPTQYAPRLFHFFGKKNNITVKQVARNSARLNPEDVFILDMGLQLFQWNGSESSKDERFKAMQYMQHLKSERPKASYEVLEELDTSESHEFFQYLDQPDIAEDLEEPKEEEATLIKVSDSDGQLKEEQIKTGSLEMKDFQSEDVFIVDTGKHCFVWIGNEASKNEKQNGIGYAHNHLMKTSHPFIPIHVLKEGQQNKAFILAVAA